MIYPVSLSRTIKAELIKARSVKSTKVLPIVALVLGLLGFIGPLLVWLSVRDNMGHEPVGLADHALIHSSTNHAMMTALFAGVLALLLVTQDLRYGVTNATFVANGSKHRIAGAKMIVGVALSLLIGVVVSLVIGVAAIAVGAGISEAVQPARYGVFWLNIATGLVGIALSALMATGFGLLARRTVPALLLFIFTLWGSAILGAIIEGLTSTAEPLKKLGEYIAGAMPAFLFTRMQPAEIDIDILWASLGYAAWCVAIALLGYLVFQRRDLGSGQ